MTNESVTVEQAEAAAPTDLRSIKDRLRSAAGSGGQEDEHWHIGGTERLYFHAPDNEHIAGYVDVRALPVSDTEAPFVKVELWVPSEMAERIIALVCKRETP